MAKEKTKEKTNTTIVEYIFAAFIILPLLVGSVIAIKEASHNFFINTPAFYSSAATTLKNLTSAHFIPLLPAILITLALLIIMAIVRYRPAFSQKYSTAKLPTHPAIASYAMRGGFFDPNRIIALTISHLARQNVLIFSNRKRSVSYQRTTKDDSSLTDIDKAVLHFLERIHFYQNNKNDLFSISSADIQEFAYTDRKLYNDFIDEIRDVFYRQAEQEKVKENPANLFISATFVWIVGLFIVGIALALFEIATRSTPILFLVSISLLALSLSAFIIVYLMLSSGVPWSYRAGRQGARINKKLRSASRNNNTTDDDIHGFADALSIVSKQNAKTPLLALYKSLPAITIRKWIRPTSAIAYFFSTHRLSRPKVLLEKIAHFFREYLIAILIVLPVSIAALSGLYFITLEQGVSEGNDALRTIGLFMLASIAIPIAVFLLLRISHFVLNLPSRLSSSTTRYSRKLPRMHPAIASFLDKGGVISAKRILSSSLLHLVAKGVLGVEKRENAQGEETVIFIQKYDDVETSKISKIDRSVLKLVDFVIRDRLAKRNNARIEELEHYGISPQVKRVAFLEDFTIVAKKEKKEYTKHAKELSQAIIQEVKDRHLLANFYTKERWHNLYLYIATVPMLFIMPGIAILNLPLGIVTRIAIAAFPILLFFALAFFLPDFSNIYIPLSSKGHSAAANLRPLKRWLEDFTLLEEKDVLSVKVWKEYIAYASAFGLPAHVYHDLSQLVEDNDDVFKLLIDYLHTTIVK